MYTSTVYRWYLIIAAIVAILLTMHLFGNVYAGEPKSVADLYGFEVADEPECMSDSRFEALAMEAFYYYSRHRKIPPTPSMCKFDLHFWNQLMVKLGNGFYHGRLTYVPPAASQPPQSVRPEVHIHVHPPGPSQSGGSPGSTGAFSGSLPIINYPKPPNWDVNDTYIPSWRQQHDADVERYRLEKAQEPTKGQSFKSFPRGLRFKQGAGSE